jgi:hypothetical protein
MLYKIKDTDNMNLLLKNERILVYTCCDEVYSHYIPIFCNTILRADKLKVVDIEIGINLNKLNDNEEKAMQFLRKKYYYSKIKINYNFFIKNKTGTYYKNIKVRTNSVRFISQPSIKNKYVYITDVDMFIFVDNFYLELIDDMIKRRTNYSNLVRPNSHFLTGLHFTLYDAYYPIPKQKIYNINDEILLHNIVKSKGNLIDYKTQYRPYFGIHASPHRANVGLVGTVGWFAEQFKFKWIKYCKSNDFKFIYPLLNIFTKKKIKMLNEFYGISINEFLKYIS